MPVVSVEYEYDAWVEQPCVEYAVYHEQPWLAQEGLFLSERAEISLMHRSRAKVGANAQLRWSD